MSNSNLKRNVLVIAGHDPQLERGVKEALRLLETQRFELPEEPSGGAGIQADIEAVSAAGCRALSVITVLTKQDTRSVQQAWIQNTEQVKEQLELLLDDIPVHACKIGLLGSVDIVKVVANTLAQLSIPLVLDPVLQSGTGDELASQEVVTAMQARLFPLTTVITPNSHEPSH